MSAPKPYNGHHCLNCWNVSLWLGNDEPLYRAALECLERPVDGRRVTLTVATNRFLHIVGQDSRTPDGARYTFKAVRSAMAGFMER